MLVQFRKGRMMKKTLISGILIGLLLSCHIHAFTPTMMGVIAQSADFIPTDISDCELWLDANQITGLNDGDSVTTWSDESGNSHDATQSTAGYKPTYETNEINSLPTVRFDGTDDFLTLGTALGKPANWTVFVVMNTSSTSPTAQTLIGSAASSGNSNTIWGQIAISNNWLGSSPQGSMIYNFGEDPGSASYGYTTSGVVNISTNYCLSARYTSGNNYVELFEGGDSKSLTKVSTLATASSGTVYDFSIGRLGEITGSNFVGDIAEVIIYSKSLTDTELGQVETYIDNKYNF